MKTMRSPLTLLLILAAAGCQKAPKTEAAAAPIPDHWTQEKPSDKGAGSLDPNPLDPTQPTQPTGPMDTGAGKLARRLSVDQLRRSIPILFGGLTWSVQRGGNQPPVLQFDALSRTLGEADYLQATENNLEPSSLFAKFMDDMAGDVCKKAVDKDRDRTQPAGTEKLVLHNPNDVDANLRWLRLKFHGILVPEGSTAGIAELRRLYDDIASDTGRPEDAWLGVCVAVLTAPEFMAY